MRDLEVGGGPWTSAQRVSSICCGGSAANGGTSAAGMTGPPRRRRAFSHTSVFLHGRDGVLT
ncbi:MAG: hypothetical protein ACRDL7_04965 [Gaiellaceae bacterium]